MGLSLTSLARGEGGRCCDGEVSARGRALVLPKGPSLAPQQFGEELDSPRSQSLPAAAEVSSSKPLLFLTLPSAPLTTHREHAGVFLPWSVLGLPLSGRRRGRFPAPRGSAPYLMFLRSAVRAFTTALKASSLPGATHLSGWSSTASFL